MKTLALKALSIFFVLLVATSVMMDVFKTEFGTVDFFSKHHLFFLLFITIFPRLTLLFSSVVTGGFIWWLGFIFCPRVLVASLATVSYFHTNPLLVTISWLVAIGGEVLEKMGIGGTKKRFIFRSFKMGTSHSPYEKHPQTSKTLQDHDVIEAEFTRRSE
jgi:hypothetical protein